MYHSLKFDKEILEGMAATFIGSRLEEGYLLGCSAQLNHITHAEYLPASKAGLHFYIPDSQHATETIKRWSAQKICFCGFLHSHVTNKQDLSKADLEFAEILFQTYQIPILWFGLAVVSNDTVTYQFCSITKDAAGIHMSPISFAYPTHKEDNYESMYS